MFESLRVGSSKSKSAAATLVGVFQNAKSDPMLDASAKALDTCKSIAAATKRAECTGEKGSLCEAHPKAGGRVFIAGLGEPGELKASDFRSIAAAAGRRIARTKETSLSIVLAGQLKKAKFDAACAGQAFGESLGILAYNCDNFRGSASAPTPKRTKLTISSDDAAFTRGLKRGLALGESVNFSRMLSNTPPNVATPDWIAKQVQAMARPIDTLSVRVIRGEALVREKLVGLVTVGQASENKPCMIRIEYTPKGASKKGKPAVLVGKTITYDTGGLSLKPPAGMKGMKGDKDGGCAVIGAMHAIATVIKPKQRVVALLVAAENSVSDEAYRPDDVMTFRNGVTVEVTNTDAEGRLVLADGMCWAMDKENPAIIIDAATLTGGVITALGSTFAGMWCDDDELRDKVQLSADRTGERVWRLPHDQEYRDMMKSPIADILNSNPNRKAHPIQGAAFLSYFVGENIPWCHLDVAGVHRIDSDRGPFVKDTPSGFGVRLIAGVFES